MDKRGEIRSARLQAGGDPALIHFSLEFCERISSTGCISCAGSRSFERFSPVADQHGVLKGSS